MSFPWCFIVKNVKHTATLNLYLYTCHLHSAGNNFLYLLYHISPFLNPPSNPFYFWMHFKVNSIIQCKFRYTEPLNTSICISLTRDHILFSFFFFLWTDIYNCVMHICQVTEYYHCPRKFSLLLPHSCPHPVATTILIFFPL